MIVRNTLVMGLTDILTKLGLRTPQNKAYELHYWTVQLANAGHQKYLQRYHKIYDLFPTKFVSAAERVADVGCGPLGGMFSVFDWPHMVAVDPLWPEYEKMFGFAVPMKKVTRITGFAEDLPKDGFDLIWAINSLDHAGNLRKSLHHLCSSLRDGGHLMLHIHMRTKMQLNPGHRMVLTEAELYECCSWDWVQILPACPIEQGAYRTFLGVHVCRKV